MSDLEIWKQTPEYPDYEVSTLGRVRSTKFIARKVKNLKPWLSAGYYNVQIQINGQRISKKVHVLMLETFVSPRPGHYNKIHACHSDGNPLNNNLSNLRWDTASNNAFDKNKHDTMLRGEKNFLAKLTREKVLYIRKHYRRLSNGLSNARELAKELGVARQTITYAASKKRGWKHIE